MEINQISEFLGTVYGEVTGKTNVVNENLNNIVDVGAELLSQDYREKYVNSLFNRIGRMEFVERPYEGAAPDISRKRWEWGSILSKSRTKDMPAVDNPAWSLVKGETVNQFEYNPPEVQTTLFNKMITWEIDLSFVDRQLRQSFTGPGEYDRFMSMLRSHANNNNVQNLDELTMRCINNLIGHRIARNVSVIDVGTLYNTINSTNLTLEQAPYSKDFGRFLAYQIMLYKSRLRRKTANFSDNSEGYTTFTPKSYQHTIILDVFSESMKVYLQSDTFNKDLVEIGDYDTVSYWQGSGSGTAYPMSQISRITADVAGLPDATKHVDRPGILGIVADRDAMGIINEDRRVEVSYNRRGEYWNNFFKVDTRLFNDPAENALVFTFGTPPVVDLTPKTMSILVGGTGSITAATQPAGLTVTWDSTNKSVATVSNGTVTGVAAGTADIKASATSYGMTTTAATATTVREAVAPTVSLDSSTATVAVDATVTLTATATPDTAVITWASSDETVATVSGGVVTGKSAGSATITATATNDELTATDTCTVTVTSE